MVGEQVLVRRSAPVVRSAAVDEDRLDAVIDGAAVDHATVDHGDGRAGQRQRGIKVEERV